MSQSPSYRGSLSYSGESASITQVIAYVSIPFLSGQSFLLWQLTRNGVPIKVSIPFLSGQSFLHDRTWNLNQREKMSQSPSYRGSLSYPAGAMVEVGRRDVSIPFLSGQSFLRRVVASPQWHHAIVSIPFLSGQSFLQTHSEIMSGTALLSQSPSYWGSLSYTWLRASLSYWFPRLNPLPIGAVFPTNNSRIFLQATTDKSQSPSYRGSHQKQPSVVSFQQSAKETNTNQAQAHFK